jgi:hypothetical protein
MQKALKLKHLIKNQLIALYSTFLKNNFIFGARLINYFLPKNNFAPKVSIPDISDLQLENRIADYLQWINLERNSQQRDANFGPTYDVNLEKKQISIFVTHRDLNSLTSEVFLHLAHSYGACVGDFLVIDEDGLIIESQFDNHIVKPSVNFSGHIFEQKSVELLIFFELHFISRYASLFLFDNFPQINTRFFVICFDLWRDEDRRLINSSQLENVIFVHMDTESASLIQNKKLVDWIFVGHDIYQNHDGPNLPLSLYFSGNLKTQDRRNWILITKLLARRFGIRLSLGIFNYVSRDKRVSQSDYKKKISLHPVILGLSQKTERKTLITFRSIEALALGRTLLQQELPDSKPLSQYAVP